MSFLQSAAALVKTASTTALTDLEVQAIPIVQNALALLQKSPNALGAAAAEAYLLGNAPAALVTAEQQFVNTEFGVIGSALQGLLTQAQASAAANSAGGAAAAPTAS